MTPEQRLVLGILYQLERPNLETSQFDTTWTSPQQIAGALPATHPQHNDADWARQRLEELWKARKVLQLPSGAGEHQLRSVQLTEADSHIPNDRTLKPDQADCRFQGPAPQAEQVAIFGPAVEVKYRSRIAETCRLLSFNYQRFNMAPATGLLRYEARRQRRPSRGVPLLTLRRDLARQIEAGSISVQLPSGTMQFPIRAQVNRKDLRRAVRAVLRALRQFLSVSNNPCLSQFQANSIAATLCGVYSDTYRQQFSSHIITAGVGSGKSYAFQIGALIHAAYSRIRGETGLKILLLYPRVALAANQFQDLGQLAQLTEAILNVGLQPPLLDAGSQLADRLDIPEGISGRTFTAIRRAYGSGEFPIIITNLDTLVNRINHPEACRSLAAPLDLIVLDEVHLLQGIYGSHAKMMLKRIGLLRGLWRERSATPNASFQQLLSRVRRVGASFPYIIGASATIAEPCRHMARLLESQPQEVLHVAVDTPDEHGWVHHIFLRQKPQVGSLTALINATSCLIHNRRDGMFREYYRNQNGTPLSLDELRNPIRQNHVPYELQPTDALHKTIGFSDSLDAVGRWVAQASDNERASARTWGGLNPARGELPYFCRFNEPLWRVPHSSSFATPPPPWLQSLRAHYGNLCLDCKKGIPRTVDRIPPAANQAVRRQVQNLWDFSTGTTPTGALNFTASNNYLNELGVRPEVSAGEWLQPVRAAAASPQITNLSQCPFFQAGLCWWWSMDHAGNNVPAPLNHNNPLAGLKKLTNSSDYCYPNSARTWYFTSKSKGETLALDSIDDLYRADSEDLFNSGRLRSAPAENAALLVGSPRLEVGIDLTRAGEGLTFRTLRDPASFQQKIGRAGRELNSDSVWVHVVTGSLREQYYFRNTHVALDPEYLQPIPLHEDNRIIACQHFLMAVFDFLCLQSANPGAARISNDGDRLLLINDHINAGNSFSGWNLKLMAVYDYLFGNNAVAATNLANLTQYLRLLGATQTEIAHPQAVALAASAAPMSQPSGVLDVLRHDLGPLFFQTLISTTDGGTGTIAEACSTINETVLQAPNTLPRHREFLSTFEQVDENGGRQPYIKRSYFRDLLKLPIFRRGLPSRTIQGNTPYVWPPNLFASVGTESVRIVRIDPNTGLTDELAYEALEVVTSLLLPGTLTYRFGSTPLKVAVGDHQCAGRPTQAAPGVYGVVLRVANGEFFDRPNIAPLQQLDLPREFMGVAPLHIYKPKQLYLIPANQEPRVSLAGLLLDDDSADFDPTQGIVQPNPPNCYALKWYRIQLRNASALQPRWGEQLRPLLVNQANFTVPQHPVFASFQSIRYDQSLLLTEFAWGLDRQFTNRNIRPSRLVYRGATGGHSHPVGIGDEFETRGLIFTLGRNAADPVPVFLGELMQQPTSAAYQSLLLQALHAFISEHARTPNQGGPSERPSPFAVQDIKSIVLFHLLSLWHTDNGQAPAAAPSLTIAEIAGCFNQASPQFISQQRFNQLANEISEAREPQVAAQFAATLQGHWSNFNEACAHFAAFNQAFASNTAEDILVNSLAMTLHSAALRLAGAQDQNLGYFYKRFDDRCEIYLFDTDAFGNGTVDLIKDNLHTPAFLRSLADRMRQCGNPVDPLPTRDFAQCLEEELQECAESQAAHLAFLQYQPGTQPAYRSVDNLVRGEARQASALFVFMRQQLGLTLFDQTFVLRACPEFLAHITANYARYNGQVLVGTLAYPSFQALESAMRYCTCACISCLMAPEQNIHGSLAAEDTVNKVLLDAFYRRCVCERTHSDINAIYPGPGAARTVSWATHASLIAQSTGLNISAPAIEVRYPVRVGGSPDHQTLRIPFSVRPANCFSVLRTGWQSATTVGASVRVVMEF